MSAASPGAAPPSAPGNTRMRGVKPVARSHYAFVGREVNHKCAKREEMGA